MVTDSSPPPIDENRRKNQNNTEGISPADLLSLPTLQKNILTYLLRHGSTTSEKLAEAINQPIDSIEEILENLINSGHIAKNDNFSYRPCLRRKKNRCLSTELWKKLDN
jgi:predicted HTH transcriptional regulator